MSTIQELTQMAKKILKKLPLEREMKEVLDDILDTYQTPTNNDDTAMMSFYNSMYYESVRGTQPQRKAALERMAITNATLALSSSPLQAQTATLYAKAHTKYAEDYLEA